MYIQATDEQRLIRESIARLCADFDDRYRREARLMKLAPVTQEMIFNFVTEHVLGLPRSN